MKLVSINSDLLSIFSADPEVLQKNNRPYVLVLRLKYRGRNQDFAIPIRSNIPAASPKISISPYRLDLLPDRKIAMVFIT